MDYILNVCDPDELKKEDYAVLYGKMLKYAGWLFDKRDRNKSGIPQYYHAGECGWVDVKAFKNGRPVQSADLLALTVLLAEYCGKLANKAGIEPEAGKWMNESGVCLPSSRMNSGMEGSSSARMRKPVKLSRPGL